MKLGETIVSVGIILAMTLCVAWQGNRIDKLKISNAELTSQLSQQVEINKDYEKRINSLHELDTKHTTELTNAKAEIDKLRDAVRSGRKRVYINAECPSTEKSPTSSVDASRSATLARDAEQDYFDLLKQLETLEKQYLGLRDYYYSECSNDSLSI
ncbi:lysis protein [Clostridium sporogenes]|uniref:lysis protein n=1 Tax=Bacteria TaxID=2 RepID=UPI00235E1EB6|nr:lysis protein [Proteus mirabilis]MDC9730705.1 lysis protein [Proteus mirabilis]